LSIGKRFVDENDYTCDGDYEDAWCQSGIRYGWYKWEVQYVFMSEAEDVPL